MTVHLAQQRQHREPAHWSPVPAASCEPTALHRLLLTAIFGDRHAAIAAWHEWEAQIDIEDLDEGSYWLLPRLYRRLRDWDGQLSSDDRQTYQRTCQRITGLYRHVWSRNQMILREVGEIVEALKAARISVVVLGGAAIVAEAGADMGARRADDSGFWVPAAALSEAVAVLRSLGWETTTHRSPVQLQQQQTFVGLHRGRNFLTLHWWVLPECAALERDDFERGAVSSRDGVPLQLGTVAARGLDRTDRLFVDCIRATRWQPRSPVYFLADAIELVRRRSGSQSETNSDIDWKRLVEYGCIHRLNYSLRASLEEVLACVDRPELHAEIDAAIRTLQGLPASAPERWEARAKARPSPLLGQLQIGRASCRERV